MSATVPLVAAAVFTVASIALLIYRLTGRRRPEPAPHDTTWRSWAVDTHEWVFDPRHEEN